MKQNINIEQLYVYPLKSSKGQLVDKVQVQTYGFDNDRRVAVIDSKSRVVTGREHPKLVLLSVELNDSYIAIISPSTLVTFALPKKRQPISIKLFRSNILGIPFRTKANEWVSEHLGGDYRFVYLGDQFRQIPEKRGGRVGDLTGFVDSSPVHLVNTLSLDSLNTRLSKKVTIKNFRPNIVVQGNEPFEEDQWEKVLINGLEYRVQERTQRCIFTTVDPNIGKLDETLEPLSSIAGMRSAVGKRPTFGINLVPSGAGTLNIGNIVEVLTET